MRHHGLHAQGAVEVRLQQGVNPAGVLVAAFRAIISGPEGDDGDETRFVLGNHDQASSESVDIFQGTGEGGGNRGLYAVGFLGLGYKFDAESRDRGKGRCYVRRRARFQRRVSRERITDRIFYSWVKYWTCQSSSNELAHPWEREAHPDPFRAGLDAPTGAHGDRGRFPTDKDSRSELGVSTNE